MQWKINIMMKMKTTELIIAIHMILINNNGLKEKNFDLKNIWSLIILKDDQQTRQKCIKLFHQTQINLINLEKEIQLKNKQRRIPYNACCVSYLQSSACL